MPNYDFKCEECGNKFSKRVSFDKKDEVSCAGCGSDKTKQIFTSVMVKGAKGPAPADSSGGGGCGPCSGGTCC